MRSAWAMGVVLLSLGWALGCGGAGDREAEGPHGPIDEALAAQGESLLQAKGCSACHTVGAGRLVGPDLAGVTTRRSYGFVIAMITNPDSMLASDDTAKALLGRYFTPMTNQGVNGEEARALFEFFRRHDAEQEP